MCRQVPSFPRRRPNRRIAAILLVIAFLLVATAVGQTTVFNVPSTDVQSPKKLTVEGDFGAHLTGFDRGGFQSFGYRSMYGVARNLEVGWNIFYTRNGRAAGPKEFQPNIKYRYYQNEKRGIAASGGAEFFMPMNRNAGPSVAGLFYTNLSKTVKRTGGTRVTGGFYTVAGGGSGFGTRRGALAAVEQPLKGKFSMTGDWFSGRNRLGYASAGILMAVTKRQYFQVGYNFGNSGRGNNSFAAFYGITY